MYIQSLCFPYKNTARNITCSTLNIIEQEISRANLILSTIPEGNTDSSVFLSKWQEVVEKIELWDMYKSYLRIDITYNEEHEMTPCEGFLSSQLVSFIIDLEDIKLFVHPCNKVYLNIDIDHTQKEEKGNMLTTFLGISASRCEAGAVVLEKDKCVGLHVDV
jgi:poly(A) polymerase Pap1